MLPDWPNDNNGCYFFMSQLTQGDHPEGIQKSLIPIYKVGNQFVLPYAQKF